MPTDRFFIAPYDSNSGLQRDQKPWLIPDSAFSTLDNAYVWRGRVRKRFGSRWLNDSVLNTRLRTQINAVAGQGITAAGTVAFTAPGAIWAVGQMFSIGGFTFTVYNPAAGPQQMLRSDGLAAVATFNITNGAYNITGVVIADGTPVYYYPSVPVMGLLTTDTSLTNDEFVIGFDTQFAYQYIGGWERLALGGAAAIWTGSDSQFFWGTTWFGATGADRLFFVTNFNQPDLMRYLTFSTLTWTVFNPTLSLDPITHNPTFFLDSARIIVPFKNRLVCFNTWERDAATNTPINYVNRARYSQVGNPLEAASDEVPSNRTGAWRQDVPGKGNAIDCPTSEAIITVEFIKDRLIVFFERSTWEFLYLGNQAYPFGWQLINTELGAESTFSVIPFDKVAIGVGNVGIHACNGINVERIDSKIPDEVFNIHNIDAGVERVYGIRDYYVEMLYWAFPATDATAENPYPARVLVYNYKTNTWSFNDDSITCFGYFQPTLGITWDSTEVTWDDEVSWSGGSSGALFRNVIAGNQEGFTFIVDADVPKNAPALQITNMTVAVNVATITAINHNLRDGEFVFLQDIAGTGNITLFNNRTFIVMDTPTKDTFLVADSGSVPIAGTYLGQGVIARVSRVDIWTKEYNFYANKGRNAYISRIDFMVDCTALGQMQLNLYVSTALDNLTIDGAGTGTLVGTNVLDTFAYTNAASPIPYEATASRVWRPIYFQADGECVQFEITMNDLQMTTVNYDPNIGALTSPAFEDFQLHAVVIFSTPTSVRLQ